MYKTYDYVVVGAGIAGCSLAYFLSQKSDSVLLLDKNDDVAIGASGAAGAFLSPLLGKPNAFKTLVTKSLAFSVDFYKKNFPDYINSCGTCRIPKNQDDKEKFESYEPYMDFEYKQFEDGFFFPIGCVVDSYNICKSMVKNINTQFSYEVSKLHQEDSFWIINDEIKAKKLFLTTGADISLINEKYFNIRAVWGQRINISTTSEVSINYHKECSLSQSKKIDENKNLVSIGATHNRFEEDTSDTSYNLALKNVNKLKHNDKTKKIMDDDSKKLLKLANNIKSLSDVNILDIKIGARASSVDYFPMLGKLVDSQKSIEKYPHIINGSFIKEENLEMIENLYVLNGVGGRGFVLSPYLAKTLVDNIFEKKEIPSDIKTYRLFKRWAKRLKNSKK